MLNLLLVAIAFGGLCGFPLAAFKGWSYRGVFLGWAIFAIVMGAACSQLIPSGADYVVAMRDSQVAENAGTILLFESGPAMTVAWFGWGIGALIGAAVYRARK